ncbi:unnamed protein product [Prorocentrum cordatum]|uniref:K Homology domain-containing protein n=1 Tax=Prorocentrum cordatum TaxID=2364126 RepID=A0ABN9VA46_9DINO|nr:unnamed protein product [Polarella glacialis]
MCTTSPLCRVFPAVAEFCSLRFDEVDTTEQMGLTCRMLATLKSFAHDVTYWEEGVKIDEPAFTLLGLDEVAQFALLRTAERAAALVDERCWREAYQALCAARPWVSSEPDSGPAQEQRAGAEAELARVEARARRESGEPRGPPRTGPCGGSAAGGPPAAGSVAVVVRLPAGGAGRVLGPHAATVTALQAETGARVWLDRASDEAHVSGTPEAVEAVRRGIRFLLTPVRGEDRGRHVAQARAAALEEGVRPDHVPVLPERHLQQGQRVPFPARARPAEQRRRGDARQHRRRAARRHQREEQQGRGQGRSAGPPSHGLGRRQASEGRRRFGKPERDLAGVPGRRLPRAVAQRALLDVRAVRRRRGLEEKKEPIGYDEAAGVYWLGAARAHVAVRAGPDRLDWYPAGDQEPLAPGVLVAPAAAEALGSGLRPWATPFPPGIPTSFSHRSLLLLWRFCPARCGSVLCQWRAFERRRRRRRRLGTPAAPLWRRESGPPRGLGFCAGVGRASRGRDGQASIQSGGRAVFDASRGSHRPTQGSLPGRVAVVQDVQGRSGG